ncbi:hypothetical protein TRFO_41775 [Tritrichomonas foetus]|uniref:Uncharacterized protein n=1 Tax=Tritrichomonas foetus TaxID=1144522 RepID=A0A1J4KZ26_9EUKA|nr:hypothetical protein TRFO_41775 [Tritrichomonas foetus]|eukprot:OHT16505.1 hypothetical protein TRFO_41775 [Tritrichomonas foetus]
MYFLYRLFHQNELLLLIILQLLNVFFTIFCQNSVFMIFHVDEDFFPSVTFISCPFPVTTASRLSLYQLTMSSWLRTPNSKIMITLKREEFDPLGFFTNQLEEKYGQNSLIFTDSIESDENGIPYIDDWFVKGMDKSTTDLVCWINSDIVIPDGWYDRIRFLHSFFFSKRKQFGAISRRCDFNYRINNSSNYNMYNVLMNDYLTKNHSKINKSNELDGMTVDYEHLKENISKIENKLRSLKFSFDDDYDEIAKDRKRHSKWGVDFFLISKKPMQLNIDEIPNFRMGRYRWDPWTTAWLNQNILLVSLGNNFCTYHVNHKPTDRRADDPLNKENFEIAGRNGKLSAGNHHAKYSLDDGKLFKYGNKLVKSDIKMRKDNAPISNDIND